MLMSSRSGETIHEISSLGGPHDGLRLPIQFPNSGNLSVIMRDMHTQGGDEGFGSKYWPDSIG
ncbi:hypothetical protein M758_UG220500 [Ceratodon purpureus]|nr:hypothetical protein M758_UG220500 [Ceratodon purpureus]